LDPNISSALEWKDLVQKFFLHFFVAVILARCVFPPKDLVNAANVYDPKVARIDWIDNTHIAPSINTPKGDNLAVCYLIN
jgi:hypothetical protein